MEKGERGEVGMSVGGLLGGRRDGCKADQSPAVLGTALEGRSVEVKKSYGEQLKQRKKEKEIGLNKFPHMLCKTALLINETELSLITMRLSVVYNNKKCPTVLAHQVGAIVLPTQIVIKK